LLLFATGVIHVLIAATAAKGENEHERTDYRDQRSGLQGTRDSPKEGHLWRTEAPCREAGGEVKHEGHSGEESAQSGQESHTEAQGCPLKTKQLLHPQAAGRKSGLSCLQIALRL
jgi:hypothetical protein